MASLLLALKTGGLDLYAMTVLTLIVKAWMIPAIFDSTLRKINFRRGTEKFIGRELSLILAIGLVVFSYALTTQFGAISLNDEQPYLADAISMLFIGLFVMMTHKKAIMQGIGLVVIENGLFLFALSTATGMPFIVDIGIMLNVFMSVILISLLSYRMNQTFKSISTDWLRKLKG